MKQTFFKFSLLIFFCVFYSCSSDEEFGNNDYSSPSSTDTLNTRSTSYDYIQNIPYPMFTYITRNRVDPAKLNYVDSYYMPWQINNLVTNAGIRYYICYNLTTEANVRLYHIYNVITGRESLGLENDILGPGEEKWEQYGFIYKKWKEGLYPLKEFYSKKNDEKRYFIYDHEVQTMKNEGGDYVYTRFLGYVAPSRFIAPAINVISRSKVSEKYIAEVYQIQFGSLDWVGRVFLNPFTTTIATPINMGGMKVKFRFNKSGDGDLNNIIEIVKYIPQNSIVFIDMDENGRITINLD